VRDSLLRDMRDTIATVARTRVKTGGQRDALIKDGMLRNRVSGRVLLDPVVGNGTYSGRSNGAISVPFLEPGPSRATRVRDSISFAERTAPACCGSGPALTPSSALGESRRSRSREQP
jgi:hypothetical protein